MQLGGMGGGRQAHAQNGRNEQPKGRGERTPHEPERTGRGERPERPERSRSSRLKSSVPTPSAPAKHNRRASWSRTLKIAAELHAVRKWENPELGKRYLVKTYCADIRHLHAEEKERRRYQKEVERKKVDWEKEEGWLPLHDREE